jgi:hypothetical protein
MNESELVILARNHQGEFRRFIDEMGLPQDFKVKIGIGSLDQFPKTRNVAYTEMVNPRFCRIVFAPKWDQLTDSNYIAVLRHEYGHVLHLMYPQIFKMMKEREGLNIHPSQEEIFSDYMGSRMFGDHIFYDDGLIQTLETTDIDIRPRHLGW